MKLQIGMKVKIKSDPLNYGLDHSQIKTITSHLEPYGNSQKRAFGLDGDTGIWLIEDFSEFTSYPGLTME